MVDTRYDGEDGRTPVEAIVDALAEAEGVDTTALAPLYEVVDPDALDRLLTHEGDGSDSTAIFGFQYDAWNVFVCEDGRIRVCDSRQPTDPEPVFDPLDQ